MRVRGRGIHDLEENKRSTVKRWERKREERRRKEYRRGGEEEKGGGEQVKKKVGINNEGVIN